MTVPVWMLLGFAAWTVLCYFQLLGCIAGVEFLPDEFRSAISGLIRSRERIGIGARCGLTRTASRTFLCLELLCLHFTLPASAAPL